MCVHDGTDLEDVARDPLVGQQLDRYTVEEQLGEGGMASVYRARHRIGEVAAIKILHPSYAKDREVRERFQREARAVHRFSHRSAVVVRDDGDVDSLGLLYEVISRGCFCA